MAPIVKQETKETVNTASVAPPATQHETTHLAPLSPSPSPKEKFKAAITALDAERTALVKNTIENLQPGRPFDHAVIREINKIETRKNRLLVSRFAAMLKKNEPGVMPIVHQIIEI